MTRSAANQGIDLLRVLSTKVTVPSPLNAPVEKPTAHGVVEVWADRIVIHGSGIVPSRELPLSPPRASL
ncbi:hypothetical protein AK812_SmicGene26043 [Symbiodinium microadriaticum]|uniref:Uncharacterized protein n=1 Tax=Symbiodinium microadriaticum TaxID=2951 RepID=A0A1Q9DAM0_SYMMI|nr:hypothetical protein AK812_SmicGene26043 [Symbiodinium microadriaticum]